MPSKMTPDIAAIEAFLERLYSHVTIDGCIEIAYTLPDTGNPNQARMFPVDDYAIAAEFAAQMSAVEGQNVYLGVGIRRPDMPHARAKDEDVVALTALFADFDEDGQAATAKTIAEACSLRPPIAVVTGKHPHVRAHFYWNLEEPIRDRHLMRQSLATVGTLFGGDAAVKNPSRIMRIPGTIAYPKKAGRTKELTELQLPTGRRQMFHAHEFSAALRSRPEAPRMDQDAQSNVLAYPATNKLPIGPLATKNAESKAAMLRGTAWHNEMVKTAGRMVTQGHTDAQIQAFFADTTMPGYTLEDTAREVQVAVDGARKKGFAPKAVQAATIIAQERQQIPNVAPAQDAASWDVGNADNHLQVTWFEDIEASTDTADFVEDTLGQGQMSVIYGESNSGKTFFACDLALHVSMGWPWRGKETEQAGVIYCALEGTHGITNRLAAFKAHYDEDMAGEIPPFGIITTAINLLDPEADTRRLIDTIKAATDRINKPIGLVVVDTLSRAISGGNENSPDDMGALVINSDRIRQATNAHVMWIHHSGKDQARGARGHSLLRAATDTEIEVRKDEASSVSVAAVKKQREYEGGQEYPFSLKQIQIGKNRRDKMVTSCVVMHDAEAPVSTKKTKGPTGKNQKIVFKELQNLMATDGIAQQVHIPTFGNLTCVSETSLRSAVYKRLAGDAKHKSTSFERAIDSLVDNEFAWRDGDWIWAVR